jgi:hypothetical protein
MANQQILGTGILTGCSGTWSDPTMMMTVTCGNCMVTLTEQ